MSPFLLRPLCRAVREYVAVTYQRKARTAEARFGHVAEVEFPRPGLTSRPLLLLRGFGSEHLAGGVMNFVPLVHRSG